MKRLHVHVAVADLEQSIRFYSTLFGVSPSKRESDYAKWMLDDPRVNFAISTKTDRTTGLSHLGIQAEDQSELEELASRAREAGNAVLETDATCCYARSNKAWVEDPTGLRWETFYTFGEATTYGQSAADTGVDAKAKPSALSPRCCR